MGLRPQDGVPPLHPSQTLFFAVLERSPPTRTPEKVGFDEPTQVGFAPISAVKTAAILIPNSR
ncbi:hypothetical protein H6G89_23550 [Oscillatoria sp. FACHB-1407]|uniref:hypothetical protein n=1 Tax=Oscillatoria sp. FACHB-1407 TaxID=2692847 RepID=UPI001683D112|nr:hypothetical protein [Oscillatoria sp. FACHB-1407]MBD2463982.1 hypothetical protein [Oscillatoria sp. FACHB-1407]